MNFPISISRATLFQILGVLVVNYIFIQVLIENYVSKQWWPWLDAAFCGVWSVSALFAYVPQKEREAYMGKGALAIRRIFSLVDMITKPKFSNCPNVFKIGQFR